MKQRECRICGEPFTPRAPNQAVCPDIDCRNIAKTYHAKKHVEKKEEGYELGQIMKLWR